MNNKKATIKDVANKAGFSISAVSYILNNTPGQSFPEETRKRIINAAKELQYMPNAIARGMRNQKSMNIGLVIFWDISDNIFNQILIGVSKITESMDYNITLIAPWHNRDKYYYIDMFKRRQIDGIIFVAPFGIEGDYNEKKHIDLIKGVKLPAVIINGMTQDESLNYIYIDFYNTTYSATKYLYGKGHRQIAYLLPEENELSAIQANVGKLRGYSDAMKDMGDREPILIAPYGLEDFVRGVKAGNGATAIVLNRLAYAKELYRHTQRYGVRVPDELSVVSANSGNYVNYLSVPVTAVQVPLMEIGEMGAKILFGLLEGRDYKQKLKLANTIVERESSKSIDVE